MGQEIPYHVRLPVQQRRTIFREMAKGELRRGPMPPRRYRALVAYAARLGIHPTESTELISQAARDLGLAETGLSSRALPESRSDQPATRGPQHTSGHSLRHTRLWLTVAVVAIAAALLDLLRCQMQ